MKLLIKLESAMHPSSIVNSIDILNHVQQGIIVTDKEGSVLYYNSIMESILGQDFKKEGEISLKSIISKDDYLNLVSMINKCKEDRVYRGKWRVKTNRGELKWVKVLSKPAFSDHQQKEYCVFLIDELRKHEFTRSNLKRLSMQVKAIFESSADAIITADSCGNIYNLSRAAVEMFGYQKREIIRKNIKQLIPSLTFKNGEVVLKRNGFDSEHIKYGEHVDLDARHKDGTLFYVNISLSNIDWNGDKRFVGIIRDLTEKRNMEKHMVDIANEERRRIGRELHDGLGQMLSGIRMVAENLARKLTANEIAGAAEVQEISEMVREADEYSRKLARGLVEVYHEDLGLGEALKQLAERVSNSHSIKCSFKDHGQVAMYNDKNALNVYRIIQEAVTNALRHSGAEHIIIELSEDGHHIVITVVDDGIGFNPEGKVESGLGMKIMKYRADIMGGKLDVYRTDQEKTVVMCTIPKDSEINDKTN